MPSEKRSTSLQCSGGAAHQAVLEAEREKITAERVAPAVPRQPPSPTTTHSARRRALPAPISLLGQCPLRLLGQCYCIVPAAEPAI